MSELYTVIMRSHPVCPYCDKVKAEINNAGIRYRTIDLSGNETAKELFNALGYTTVPIVIDDKGQVIGGYEETAVRLAMREGWKPDWLSEGDI